MLKYLINRLEKYHKKYWSPMYKAQKGKSIKTLNFINQQYEHKHLSYSWDGTVIFNWKQEEKPSGKTQTEGMIPGWSSG